MPQFDVTLAGELNLDLILYGLPAELPAERELGTCLGKLVRRQVEHGGRLEIF
jgi:hypothetical protein